MQAEPGVSRLQPGQVATSLTTMPSDSGPLDLTRLPLPFKTEELLQISDCKPPFVLCYPAQHAEVSLDWDTTHLPDALLWISNGGRAHAPWSGRHYAIGIKTDNGCFDLSRVATPPREHPLAHRRGITLEAGKPVRISYRLSAMRLPTTTCIRLSRHTTIPRPGSWRMTYWGNRSRKVLPLIHTASLTQAKCSTFAHDECLALFRTHCPEPAFANSASRKRIAYDRAYCGVRMPHPLLPNCRMRRIFPPSTQVLRSLLKGQSHCAVVLNRSVMTLSTSTPA